MKKKTKIFLAIIALFAVVVIGALAGNKISNFAETKKNAAEFDAYVIDSAFDSNEMSAEKKYIGNRYCAQGTIKTIEDWNGTARITMKHNADYDLYFFAYDNDDVLDLYEGQRIIASGTLVKVDSYWNQADFENSTFTLPED